MDLSLDPSLRALRDEVRAFVDARVIPVEDEVLRAYEGGDRAPLLALQSAAREAGLWTPHLPVEWGGRGLGALATAVLFREMGRSLVGPRTFHCDAPDQGNIDLLLRAGSDDAKARWLAPLVRGEITSAFAMTEPAPGAGADPSNLRTTATAAGDGFVLDGHKWFTTGGGEAAFLVVMAKTGDDPRRGATLFVVDRAAPGVEHVRDVPTMGPPVLHHREAELRFHAVRLGPESVLGRVGDGFALAQARLVPARLTHCMRWLGLADRALSLCKDHVGTRRSFGATLAEHQQVQALLARDLADLHAGWLVTLHAADVLEREGDRAARPFSSVAKLHVARTLVRVLDDAIQLHGAAGYSEDLPFSRWYRTARAARIADGPDEVHVATIAKDWLAGRFEPLP